MAQMRALYANVPESRPVRTTKVKPLQMQRREAANKNDMPGRARGGNVNLSGKQKKKSAPKPPSQMPPMAAPPAPVGPMAAPGGAGPMPPIGPNGQPLPGFKNGGKMTLAEDMADDKKRGIKPGSPEDKKLDKERGLPGYKNGGTENFIQKAVPPSRKGVFKAKAKAAGKTTAEYANEEAGASGKLGAEARLAQTLMHLRRK